MYLYKFRLMYDYKTVVREVIEVEEKPKTYMTTGRFRSVIKKSDIGICTGFDNSVVFLLEDDISKANKLYIEKLKRMSENTKIALERKIERTKQEIEDIENGISILQKQLEQE